MDKKDQKKRLVAHFYFSFFVLLIAGGIITKRVYGHPEFMMLWHLPAAICLVFAGKNYGIKMQQKFNRDILRNQKKT